MFVPLDRDSPIPLTRQIASYLEGLIRHGHLGPGHRLPATRTLAAGLGVNKKTVETAYEELGARRLVRVAAGRGFTVGRQPPPSVELDLPFRTPRGRDPLPTEAWVVPDEPAERSIDLAGDRPRLPNVSSRQLRLFHEGALASSRGALFAPPPPLGEASLRGAGCRQLARCGVLRSPEEVAVRSSRSAAVADALRLFVPRRGVVFADALLDPELAMPVAAHGARLVILPAVATTPDELRTGGGRGRVAPRLLLLATGTSRLPGSRPDPVRRRLLLDLARGAGIPILEDVTGTDRLDQPPIPPPLASLDGSGRVIPICDLSDEAGGEFQGTVLGGSPKILDRIRLVSTPDGPGPDRLTQRALAQALDAPARTRARRAVHEKRALQKAAITRTIRRRLPALENWEFTAEADAVRLDLPADVSATGLAGRARAVGVLVRTSIDCGATRGSAPFLLLDLTRHEEGELLEGIRRIGLAFDALEEGNEPSPHST